MATNWYAARLQLQHKHEQRVQKCILAAVVLIMILSGLLLFVVPVDAQEQHKLKRFDAAMAVSQAGLVASTAGDYLSSIRLREANPVLGQSAVRRSMVMAESSAAVGVCTWMLARKGHRRLAIIMNAAVTGLHVYAVMHNAKQR